MITSIEQVMESRLTWPENKPRAARREKARFGYHEVSGRERAIDQELERWGIKQFIVSRNNQRIYAGDPGVAVWWLDKQKQLRVLACDKWDTMAANLHAVLLTLEAMRALARWGAYSADQAAEGAKLQALPPPDAMNWKTLLGYVSVLPDDQQLILVEGNYRKLSREAAGNEARQRELNTAIEAARKELASA